MVTYKDITEANKAISVTDIKGKGYAEVNQRVKAFRMIYPEGTIETEMISNAEGVCVFRAFIKDGEHLLATGTAYEKESSSFINKTSYIENCETSAVGRALGMLGLGIDTSICSAEELTNALNNQNKEEEPHITVEDVKMLEAELERTGLEKSKILNNYKVEKLSDMTIKQYRNCLNRLKATRTKGVENE